MRKPAGIDLQGARALVTGAGSGIGRATALALAARGTEVLSVDLDAGTASETASACSRQGPAATSYSCDVADAAAVAALAEQIAVTDGPLDVLVNNAGVGMVGRFADMTLEDWRWIRAINLDGVVHCCHAFGPAMVARGRGQVVNMSSGLGYTMRAAEPAYVATKAAVLAFSRCLQADWGPHGVGVSAVCPGVINTPIISSTRFVGTGAASSEHLRADALKLFRRGHKPETVANAVVDAIVRNRTVVPVGWEARLGWVFARLAPIRAQQVLARSGEM